MATKEEVDSLLSYGEKFDAWARARLIAYDKASSKSSRELMEKAKIAREKERSRRETEEYVRSKTVVYCLSSPDWEGVDSFEFNGGKQATLRLAEKPDSVAARDNKIFPQVSLGFGRRTILVTLHTMRGWRVTEVKANGRVITIDLSDAKEA